MAAGRSDHLVARQAALLACVFPNVDADYRLILQDPLVAILVKLGLGNY